jgi:protein phosphatase
MCNSKNALDVVSAILCQEALHKQITATALPDIIPLICRAADVFSNEPPCLLLTGEFIIVGDLHGDLSSLLRIFGECGYPPHRSYLFLGDYVDRGPSSCGVLLLLFALKILFRDQIYLLRGNHETSDMTGMHGFMDECLCRFSREAYAAALRVFSELPLCAIVNSHFFCVHGGIPSDLTKLTELRKPDSEPFDRAVSDLLWSDPSDRIAGFVRSGRGRGHLFGADAVQTFLEKTGLALVIRSHEMCTSGFHYPLGKSGGVMTVFSTCDYCGSGNDAAVAVIRNEGIQQICFGPLTTEQKAKRRIVFPYWVMCHVAALDIDDAIPALEPVDNLGTLTAFQ